ncbi:MAG: FMN-binding protein [Candidatus Omnitrophica bacterium]|nr:FMN-binding protein [Candidatus Omnitrophota bacterium]
MVLKAIRSIVTSNFVKMAAALGIVSGLSGAALVYVYNYSLPKIEVNIAADTERAIKSIFPEVLEIKPGVEKDIFEVLDTDKNILGYAFLAEGSGYQGVIKLIVGVSPDVETMKGFEVIESQETPGLGAEITTDKFRGQFKALGLAHAIEYVKGQKPTMPYQIEAITGATISSRAVVNMLNSKISRVRELLFKKAAEEQKI